MFKTDNYRAMAARNGERAKNTNVPGEMHEFQKMERSFTSLANNEEWLADNFDKTLHAPAGEPLDQIPLPSNVDIGDAIKAMKSLYSLLRQLEFALRQAKSPLLDVVSRAVAQMERDVIKRT